MFKVNYKVVYWKVPFSRLRVITLIKNLGWGCKKNTIKVANGFVTNKKLRLLKYKSKITLKVGNFFFDVSENFIAYVYWNCIWRIYTILNCKKNTYNLKGLN